MVAKKAEKINLIKIIGDPIDKATRSALKKSHMNRDAKFMADQIKKRTRLGRGVAIQNGRSFKLAPLKDDTVHGREILQDNGDLSVFTRPEKSNLTATGQLLDSIGGGSTTAGSGRIFITDNRKDGVSNSEIEKGHDKKLRPFMHLSKPEINRLNRRIRERIVAAFNAALDKLN